MSRDPLMEICAMPSRDGCIRRRVEKKKRRRSMQQTQSALLQHCKRGLWGWWSWWGFSCNHLPHLVVMATQPEARALGRRGGKREREGCWEAWPSVWLHRLSFHASANWTWHFKRRKKKKKTKHPQHRSPLWADVWLSHLGFVRERQSDGSGWDICCQN